MIESLEEAPTQREQLLDLTPIKAALEEWRKLKGETTKGEWKAVKSLPEIEEDPPAFWAIDGPDGKGLFSQYGDDCRKGNMKFIAHAHNAPIEDMLQQLIDEVERLRSNHD